METKLWDFFEKINFGVEDQLDGLNYRYFHARRTLKLAREIAAAEGAQHPVNLPALEILALFHDIGKNEKLLATNDLHYADHDANNVVLFEKYIHPLLSDPALIPALREITADFSHQHYALFESRAVRDADNLDEIGILNFWRMGVYAGKHHRDVRDSVTYYFGPERKTKVEKMQGLFFDHSRRLCEERLAEMDDLLGRLRQVALGEGE